MCQIFTETHLGRLEKAKEEAYTLEIILPKISLADTDNDHYPGWIIRDGFKVLLILSGLPVLKKRYFSIWMWKRCIT